MRRRLTRYVALAALAASVVLVARAVDTAALGATARAAASDPRGLLAAVALYAAAFAIRALVWTRVLPDLRFGHALAALHVSLLGNHVLPFRLGEALRVTSVVRRAGIPLGDATASTVFLRAADVLALVGLAAVLSPRLATELVGGLAWALAALAAVACVGGVLWLRRLGARLPAGLTAAGAVAAWALESAVLWQACGWAGIDLTATEAIVVTAVTIAAQIVAVTPGGFGTYEAAATAALVALGADAGPALAAALAAHAVKTAYSLVAGAVAVAVPAPGLAGRLRLARREPLPPVPAAPGPVVLFLPAHDEEASVGAVLRRAPATVRGRGVECVVVDDGSRDGTAAAARAAGADVASLGRNAGVGAAVREGLRIGAERGAAAIAFCDADGEYAPEELERLVAPILEDGADYVVGSRFAGGPRRMRPHRHVGNAVLTLLVSLVARRTIGDGQSGYRALSLRAAAAAEIVHDYNYAQVLTLDLLGKGFRYAEVPISYAFRRTGDSFVQPLAYLRRVLPAIHRELNTSSVLDDMPGEALARRGPGVAVESAARP